MKIRDCSDPEIQPSWPRLGSAGYVHESSAIRVWSMAAVFLGAGFLAGCGDDSSSNRPGGNANVSGNWHAETTSSVGPTSFDLDFFIVQNGASLASSTVFFTGTPCATDGTLTGTVDRQAVDLTILESGGPDTITINASTDGVTMSGTYTISGSCDGGDHGNLSATFVSDVESSQWSGSTSSSHGTLTFTANLTEDSQGRLSGSMVFSGSPCFTQLTVSGKQAGNVVQLSDSQGIFAASGTTSNNGLTISGLYSVVSGACQEDGSFTMSRP
jgi:hypothetical protein